MKGSSKQWIAMSLMALMLVKAWVIPLLYLDFELRKEYIIANLCVNRDNPITVCGGVCYLAKNVADAKKQEERRAEQTSMAQFLYQVMDTRKPLFFKLPEHFEVPAGITFDYCSPFLARVVAEDIFHPPLV